MTTRIDRLGLDNFRLFRELSISFHPELTVLVAPNGGGKTAILDALAIALHKFVASLTVSSRDIRIGVEDVRLVVGPERTMEPVLPTRVVARGMISEHAVTWTRQIIGLDNDGIKRSRRTKELLGISSHLREHVIAYSERRRSDAPTLPAFCYYGTGRLWNLQPYEEGAHLSRFSGYTKCLSSASNYWSFARWFGRFSREYQSEIDSGRVSPHSPRERLEAVRAAVAQLLEPTGWEHIEWQFAEDTLVAVHPKYGRLPVQSMSDGIRNMIGMVGDLAHRCVRLNPHFGSGAARLTPGIVLIDEVDMHLHPAWQQTILTCLREAFPKIQFIVTTHSHLVVSTIPSECVRILHEDGTVSQPSVETQGYDSPFTLGVVFGVDSTPPIEIAKQLSHYRMLVEQGQSDTDDARSLQTILEKHFGAQHPAMLAVESMKRLQRFKAQVAAKRGGH